MNSSPNQYSVQSGRHWMFKRYSGLLSRGRNDRGGTLVEVMVAMIVFITGALGTSAFIYHSQGLLAATNNRMLASESAHARLEELTTVPFDNLPSFQEEDYTIEFNGISALRDTIIEDIDEDNDTIVDYRTVTVSISWTQGNGAPLSIELVRFYSPYR